MALTILGPILLTLVVITVLAARTRRLNLRRQDQRTGDGADALSYYAMTGDGVDSNCDSSAGSDAGCSDGGGGGGSD